MQNYGVEIANKRKYDTDDGHHGKINYKACR